MKKVRMISLLLALCLLAGCGQTGGAGISASSSDDEEAVFIDEVDMGEITLEDEAVALASSPPAVNDLLLPVASGKSVKSKGNASIDYSNTADGYVMAQYGAANSKRMKVQVAGPTTTYTYDLPAQSWVTFPLSDGNGQYSVRVYKQVDGTKYSPVLTAKVSAQLTDEFAPYLRPNQYVDYAGAEKTLAKAAGLVGEETDALKKVELIYEFVVNELTYDKEKAASVQSGYLPVLDNVLAAKKGICFDYAALMTGMLRSQGVPCKLVVGYAGKAYHAWISVWTEETGWVDGAIYFDGSTWQRMDPTFASSSKSSAAIMKYIGDGSNYTTKYLY